MMSYDRRAIESEKSAFDNEVEVDTKTISGHLAKVVTLKRGWLYLIMIACLLLGMYIG